MDHQEPDITINGETLNAEDNAFVNSFNDFDFKFGPEVDQEPTLDADNDYPQKKKQVIRKNDMGLPERIYLGRPRPNFDLIDDNLKESLRTRYISDIETVKGHHTDAPIAKHIDFTTANMDTLYTVRESALQYSSAVNYSGIYTAGLLIFAGVAEGAAITFGFKFLKGSTEELYEMPFFRTMAIKMATEYGAGPAEGLPVIVQIGGMVMLYMVTHAGLNMLTGKNGSKKKGKDGLKNKLMGMAMNYFVNGGNDVDAKETENGKKKGKSKGGGATDMMGFMGPMLKNFIGGGAQKKKKIKKKKEKEEESETEDKESKKPSKKKKIEEEDEDESEEGGMGIEDILGKAMPMLQSFVGGGGKKKKKKKIVDE